MHPEINNFWAKWFEFKVQPPDPRAIGGLKFNVVHQETALCCPSFPLHLGVKIPESKTPFCSC